MLAVFAYFTIILSAMQVGLATGALNQSARFQQTSLGFSAASLLVILLSLALVISVWVFLFFFHLISTWVYCKKAERSMDPANAQIVGKGV